MSLADSFFSYLVSSSRNLGDDRVSPSKFSSPSIKPVHYELPSLGLKTIQYQSKGNVPETGDVDPKKEQLERIFDVDLNTWTWVPKRASTNGPFVQKSKKDRKKGRHGHKTSKDGHELPIATIIQSMSTEEAVDFVFSPIESLSEGNKIVCNGICRYDFLSLAPGERVMDQIIVKYLGLIMRHTWENNSIPDIFVVNPSIMALLNTATDPKNKDTPDPGLLDWSFEGNINKTTTPFMEYPYVYIPYHVDTTDHWILYVVNTRSKTIRGYDSLYSSTKHKEYKQHRRYISELMTSDSYTKNIDIRWELYMADTYPKQINGIDCGVYVCEGAYQLATKNDYENPSVVQIDSRDINRLRRKIAACLINGSIN